MSLVSRIQDLATAIGNQFKLYYKKTESDTLLNGKANSVHSHAISDITNLQNSLNAKQDTLQSAINIKSINGNSILGAGNLSISGSSSLTNQTVSLTAYVTLGSASMTNVLSLSLTAGTWLITTNFSHQTTSTTVASYTVIFRISDGTTAFAYYSRYRNSADTQVYSGALSRIITLSSATTIYLQGQITVADNANRTIFSNNSTVLNAVKID